METKWSQTFDALGPGSYRVDDMVCMDDDIYVAGTFLSPDGAAACFVANYSDKGEILWYNTLGEPGAASIMARKILCVPVTDQAVVSRTDIYVLYHISRSETDQSVELARFDSLGDILWQKTILAHPGPVTGVLLPDNKGHIYVAGCHRNFENRPTIYIGRYDDTGTTSWFTTYYNELIDYDRIDFDVLQTGEPVAAGTMKDRSGMFCMRFSGEGQFTGITEHFESSAQCELTTLAVGSEDQVYMVGTVYGEATGSDILTIAIDRDGVKTWTQRFDGTAQRNDIAKTVAVDESSHVYVCGSSENASGVRSITTIKYGADGTVKWIATLGETRPAEPLFVHPSRLLAPGKTGTGYFYIAGMVDVNAAIVRCNRNGVYSAYREHGIKGKKTRPTAISGTCMALECLNHEHAEARIVKFGPSTLLGVARWD